MERIRLLIIGDTLALPGGLSYVAGMWATNFAKTGLYEVAYASITGMPCSLNNITTIEEKDKEILFDKKVKIYNIPQNDQIKEFKKVIEDFHPHIIFTNHDPWMLEVVAFNEYRPSYFWIAYTTIETPEYGEKIYHRSLLLDANGRNKNYISIPGVLSQADLVIPVTQMGKNVCQQNYGLMNCLNDNVFNGLDFSMECIENTRDKKELFGDSYKENDFVFMSIGLNSERKKHERLLYAFERFLRMNKNSDRFKLYLHCNIYSSLGGPDLIEIINKLNIGRYVIALGDDSALKKSVLYEKYKACDCYVALPGGEGFSYGYSESMLHHKPIIYINYGGHAEYAHNGGLPVKVESYVYAIRMGYKLALGDIDDCAKVMYKMVHDDKLRYRMGESGYKYAKENLSIDVVFKKLNNYVQTYYNSSPKKIYYGSNLKRLI